MASTPIIFIMPQMCAKTLAGIWVAGAHESLWFVRMGNKGLRVTLMMMRTLYG